MKNKRIPNFQDEFSIEDIEVARDITATHDCGMSRIALRASDQIYKIHRSIMKEPGSASASVKTITLKLHYAIQVWCKAALISAKNPSNLLYYWWLHWTSDGGPFNKIEYSKFYTDITVEQLLHCFWELLENIANSGEIQVAEGFHIDCEGEGNTGPKVTCTLILDEATGKDVEKKVKDVYTYPYNNNQRTYKWNEIKNYFHEMSLDQLRLTMPKRLHNHSKLDDSLLLACFNWDMEQIKLCMERGANIHCLDEHGESVLQKAVDCFKDHNRSWNENYTDEELKALDTANEIKCKEVVELLLSYGADINLFGFDGMDPLTCAYYERSPEMMKYLLEKGASSNSNCYLEDSEFWPILKNVRSTILDCIDGLISDDYGDVECEIETLIREAGGRQYVWDFNPWNYKNEGKYIVHIKPSYDDDDKMFYDNSRWKIGSSEQLVIENKEAEQTIIPLNTIKGLKEWNNDFRSNQSNKNYDWKDWKERGFQIAHQLAKLLPESVALFYLYDNKIIVKQYSDSDKLYLCYDGEPLRIK